MREGNPTIKERIKLKRSIENDKNLFHDPIDKRTKSLDEFLQDPFYLLMHKDIIGNGEYGHVKDMKNVDGDSTGVVAKISGCLSYMIGDVRNTLFRSEHVEPRLLKFLWKYLVETHISPHIICPIGSHSIVNGALPEQKEKDEEMSQSAIFFMEKCNGGNMRNYLYSIRDRETFDLHLKVLLFQICYTLGVIFTKWNNFRHNDLKDDNIFVNTTRDTKETNSPAPAELPGEDSVYRIYDKSFTIPDIGVIALIGDFDFACIGGYMFDNFKVLEQEWNTPSLNINSRPDHRADLYSLVTYIRAQFDKSHMTENLKREFDSIFGDYRLLNNYHRLFPTDTAPSVEDLFMETGFFSCFEEPKNPDGFEELGTGRDSGRSATGFNGDSIIPVRVTYERMAKELDQVEYRHVPIILPRKPEDTLLPSLIYFRNCPPINDKIDKDIGIEYSPRISNKIMQHIAFVYSCESTKNLIKQYGNSPLTEQFDNNLYYKFPDSEKEEFLIRVEERAQSFLKNYMVVLKYWYYVYACAFVDEIYESGMCRVSQKCWTHTNWGDFWEIVGVQKYTSIEMIQFVLQWNWLRK